MATIDLPAQFGRKATAMLLAIKDGRAAHAAGNIKSSGNPLENKLRQLFAESLPSTNKVASGYFYGASSRVSGEIDLLVYEDQEAFRLDPSPQEQHYVPYTSVSIVGQIKNSARDLASAIDQVQRALTSWNEMRTETAISGNSLGGPTQLQPLTFIVCGECTDNQFKKLVSTLSKKGRPFVDYILLLDRGMIVAGNLDVMFSSEFIDFLQYRNVSSLHICKPDGAVDNEQGVALLWLYFALVSKLNLDRGNNLRYHAFCRQISALYPLRPIQKLI